MRTFMLLALLAFSSTVVVTEARAEDAEEMAKFDVIMEATGSDALDSIFKKSEGPIETVATIDADIKGMKMKFVESMGLTGGTPFADAIADLSTKAEGKINLAFDENKWPTLEAKEALPDDLKNSLATLNSSLVEMKSARAKLKEAGKQMSLVVEEATELSSEPKNLGLKATKVPKAIVKSKKNVKSLNAGVDVTKSLVKEIRSLVKETTAAFGQETELPEEEE
jgi:hypothetical protein